MTTTTTLSLGKSFLCAGCDMPIGEDFVVTGAELELGFERQDGSTIHVGLCHGCATSPRLVRAVGGGGQESLRPKVEALPGAAVKPRKSRTVAEPATCSRCVQQFNRRRKWQQFCPACQRDLDRAAIGTGEQLSLFVQEVCHV